MAVKIVFVPVIEEGDAGCLATVTEFGIQVGIMGRGVRERTVKGLAILLDSHCHGLAEFGHKLPDVTPAQIELAKQVLESGFEFQR